MTMMGHHLPVLPKRLVECSASCRHLEFSKQQVCERPGINSKKSVQRCRLPCTPQMRSRKPRRATLQHGRQFASLKASSQSSALNISCSRVKLQDASVNALFVKSSKHLELGMSKLTHRNERVSSKLKV